MSLQDQLLDIERALWTNDPIAYRHHLIEEAVLVFGETGPIGRDMAIDAIPTRKWPRATNGRTSTSRTSFP